MKIIITGISGFVGQNLNTYLHQMGNEIIPLSLRDPVWEENFPATAIALIHLAGKAHDTSNTSKPEDYLIINRDLTIKLFNKFLKSEIRDFIYFSSVKAVADSLEGVLHENFAANPLTPYGKSKIEAEKYLLGQKLPMGKRLFIIRPCMIHGPGNKGNLNLMYKVVKKGIPWPLAAFHNQRSFLSIDNLSFLVEKMINKVELTSGIYNFADDNALSTNELVNLISGTLGQKTKLWAIPPLIVKLVAKIGDYLPFPLNSERLKKLTESYLVSNSKIKKDLQITNLPISSKDGLIKTFRSF
ncbi:NAD-dependent epimerase/dehydratase family protein [Sphingobacterium sp. BIGb0116]|uniref:NAD-dependent epimerase/dehydratase family protein n=1 Tax=Sphingobacterium sp. BIGb0116 TaxID=2940619 RepID=UPI002166EFA1|nr:NAD-dependent epimerase/dehydratase family protein [Sphingobacterium sp. BIGb0116]MCS4166240.1 nucleoside-diphosphate-sugar epimerase [Sphingobacterium sp. BIGb0116]